MTIFASAYCNYYASTYRYRASILGGERDSLAHAIVGEVPALRFHAALYQQPVAAVPRMVRSGGDVTYYVYLVRQLLPLPTNTQHHKWYRRSGIELLQKQEMKLPPVR